MTYDFYLIREIYYKRYPFFMTMNHKLPFSLLIRACIYTTSTTTSPLRPHYNKHLHTHPHAHYYPSTPTYSLKRSKTPFTAIIILYTTQDSHKTLSSRSRLNRPLKRQNENTGDDNTTQDHRKLQKKLRNKIYLH